MELTETHHFDMPASVVIDVFATTLKAEFAATDAWLAANPPT